MNPIHVLNGDAGLPGIQSAVNGRAARALLRRQLAQILKPGSSLGPLYLTRTKYKPGWRLLAYYMTTVCDPETGKDRTVPLVFSLEKQGEEAGHRSPSSDLASPAAHELQDEARQRGLLSPFLTLYQELPTPGLRRWLQAWPLDPNFPQLVRLGDPAHAPQLFQQAGIPLVLKGKDCVSIDPIRYRPDERHVLRYRVEPSSPSGQPVRLYAKLYEDAPDAERAYRIANRVVNWLGESMRGFQGIRPAGVSAEDAVIFYPHAAGAPLSDQLNRSPDWLSTQLRLVGAALSSLHHGPASLADELKEKTLAKEIHVILRASEHIQVLLPETGAQIKRLVERAQEINQRLPQEQPTFTHSDFKADHLLISPAGMTLIDFDTCALADPALDLGKFLADLEWWHTTKAVPGVEQSQQEFLKGYDTTDQNGRLARARLYHALILAKITIRRVRLITADWAEVTQRLINRSEEVLNSIEA